MSLVPFHNNDQPESVIASKKVNAQRQLELVLTCLFHASDPLTDDEIAERCGLLRHSAGTRRGVAVRLGLVEKAGRGVSALGNPASLWALTTEGVVVAGEIAFAEDGAA